MAHKEMTLVGRVARGKAPRPNKPPKRKDPKHIRPPTGSRLIHDLYKKIRGRRGPSDPQTGDVPPGELRTGPLIGRYLKSQSSHGQSSRKKPRN